MQVYCSQQDLLKASTEWLLPHLLSLDICLPNVDQADSPDSSFGNEDSYYFPLSVYSTLPSVHVTSGNNVADIDVSCLVLFSHTAQIAHLSCLQITLSKVSCLLHTVYSSNTKIGRPDGGPLPHSGRQVEVYWYLPSLPHGHLKDHCSRAPA